MTNRSAIALVFLLCIVFLGAPAAAAPTTAVHVVKYDTDGTTVLDETTVDYAWMEANLPVYGDGTTHYYFQGPTFDPAILWDTTETINVESRDYGAVKGTDVRDLCDLVGGMSEGDWVKIVASDNFNKAFDYDDVYTPDPDAMRMVLAWYNGGEAGTDPQGVGYPPDYTTGMRLFFFDTDTSENPYGWPVFGSWDMHENLAENRWHYYFDGTTLWPSSSGLSVKYVDRVLIYSQEPFSADFTADPLSGDAPLTVHFSDASSGATAWEWDFDNDGTVDSTEKNPAWTYTTGGTYSVSLTVTGDAGTDTETKTDYINVIEVPVADFAADTTSGAIPFTVQFTDLSSANPTSWTWDFDNDGTVDATVQNPAWTYDTPGTYTVSLTVTNAYGTDIEVKTDYIQVAGSAPVAAFEAPVQSGMIPFSVEFYDRSENFPTSWEWDFGDRSTSTEQNPVHTYEKKGTYTVTLTVANDLGSDTLKQSKYITVTDSAVVPTAAFTADVTSGDAPLTVQFTDYSVDSPTSWAWDFDSDGTVDSTEQNPIYTYTMAGTYTVSLTVTNAAGSDDEVKTDYITVSGALSVLNMNTGIWYATISEAVAAASAGDEIVVGDGSYTENVVIDKSLTLQSENGADFTTLQTAAPGSTVPVIQLTADNVYVSGFTVNGLGPLTYDPENVGTAIGNGIEIGSNYNAVTANTALGCAYGIHISWNTGNNTVSYNNCSWNRDHGIKLDMSSGNTVSHNICRGTWHDDNIDLTSSSDNLITDNLCIDGLDDGIWLDSSSDNRILNNTCENNAETGIHKTNTGGSGNIISNNTCRGNTLNGIQLIDSGDTVTYNTVSGNGKYGMWISGTGNTIYLNDIAGNSYNTGSGAGNAWNSTVPIEYTYNDTAYSDFLGNYWGDYTGYDADGDGIGDSAYVFPDGTNDYRPLMAGYRNYIIESSEPTAPTAVFIADVQAGIAPLTVLFTDQSLNTPTTWTWDFENDGTVDSTEQNPEWTYNNPGTYTVSLTVTNAAGSDTEVKTDYITVSGALSVFNMNTGVWYATISEAVAAASAGDEIVVGDGNYTENVLVDKALTIRSQNGASTVTVIAASPTLPVFDIDADGVTVQGFTVRGPTNEHVAGIEIVGYDDCLVTENDCAGCYNGIHIGGDATGNIVADNYCHENTKRGISIRDTAYGNYITGNTVENNTEAGICIKDMPHDNVLWLNAVIGDNLEILTANIANSPEPLTYTYNGGIYTGYLGNYYSTYTGIDDDGDGVGETAFTSGSYYTDNYPLVSLPSEYTEAILFVWGPYLTGTTTTGTVVNVKTPEAATVTVEYADDAYYTANGGYEHSATGEAGAELHHIELTALSPGTLYHYRVARGGAATADLHFWTLPESGTFSFVAYGDSQDQLPQFSQEERHKLVADRVAAEEDVIFLLHSGDLVNDARLTTDWDRFFSAGGAMLANVTIFPTLGNHEKNATLYYEIFGMPEWYSFDAGNAHFTLLDSNDWAARNMDEQTAWLTSDLATPADWNFVTFHHPPYTSEESHWGGYANIRDLWEGIFIDNSVDMVTNGEVHVYERYLENGITYTVLGIGGGPSYPLAEEKIEGYQNSLENTLGYAKVTVDPAAGTVTVEIKPVAEIASDGSGVSFIYPEGTVFETFVLGQPAAAFMADPVSGDAPLTVQFTDLSVDATAWAWDFDNDGTVDSTDQNPLFTYTAVGTYTVSLTVANDYGTDTETKTDYIAASEPPAVPVAEFSADPLSGNLPLAVQFTDLSSGVPTSWEWDFGDRSTSTEQNPTHTYEKTGTYTVALTVANDLGSDTLKKIKYIAVLTGSAVGPTAAFTADVTTGDVPLTVQFTDQSTGDPTGWAWDFGDGGTSTEQNPVHVYTTSGTYTVKLTVTNDAGSDRLTMRKYITVTGSSVGPTAAFTADVTTGDVPLTVQFTDQSTGEGITAWAWDFDSDGIVDSTDQSPSFTYDTAGTYTVSLTVTSAEGSDDEVKTGYITAASDVIYESDFSTDPGLQWVSWLSENSIGRNDANGVILFDQRVSDVQFECDLHFYRYEGGNDRFLTFGLVNTADEMFGPNLHFEGALDNGRYYFTANQVPTNYFYPTEEISMAPLTNNEWYHCVFLMVGDTAKLSIYHGSDLVAEHTITSDPNEWDGLGFQAGATVSSPGICDWNPDGYIQLRADARYPDEFLIDNVSVTAFEELSADFTADTLSGALPLQVQFTDLSSGEPTAWEWDFGDRGTSTEQNPVHTYEKKGTYTVTLTVTKDLSEDTIKKSKYIVVA